MLMRSWKGADEKRGRRRSGSGAHGCLSDPGWGRQQGRLVKLWKARFQLYRRRFLHPNTHFSAFFEIYKIHTPSHRFETQNLQIIANFVIFQWISILFNFPDFCKCCWNFSENCDFSMRFRQNFARISQNSSKFDETYNFEKMRKFCRKKFWIFLAGRQSAKRTPLPVESVELI